tara:strand:+ start:3108 stop:3257 length:150 start_codon:yes stop_codon:yes gene_type:complete
MLDSLKIVAAGASGATVTWMESLPVIVRIGVGIATIIYIGVKTYKEYKK